MAVCEDKLLDSHVLFKAGPVWLTDQSASATNWRWLLAFFSAAWRGNATRAGRMRLARVRTKARILRLRHPVPDHAACVEVSSFAHRLAGRIVVQKFNCQVCDSGWGLEGNQNQRPTPILQELGGMPVRSRDDCLPDAQGIRSFACASLGYGVMAIEVPSL
jgi:hypothetical protein